MAELSQLETALQNAHSAGDTNAARVLAGEIVKARGATTSGPDVADVAKSAGVGVAKGTIGLLGLPGDVAELGARGIDRATRYVGGKLGVDVNPRQDQAATYGSADIQKAVEGVTGPFYKPQSIPAEYAQSVGEFLPASLLGPGGVARKVLTQSVVPGLASEGAGQATKGTDYEPYARIGAALAAPAGLGVAGILAAPITSRVAPQWFTDQKVAQILRRSDMTPQDVSASLRSAAADSQPMFMAADAMGNAGQRALSGVTRQPHDMRQPVVDMLDTRQAGQGRRVSHALAEGFDAPDTATQRVSRLLAERTTDANANYGAARANAGAVDVTPAIQKADQYLSPGVSAIFKPSSGIADTSIASAVQRAKSFLTDGKSQISDFKAAFDAKKEIDNLIEGATKTQQRELIPIQKALDDALAKSSKPYATARDTFSKQSKAIDAVDTGKDAAMRGRSEDTISAFQGLSPEAQAAFRAGYSDPLIAGTQGAAFGVNKARPLINDATAAEFPAFAAPGRADQMQRRVGREHTMFETRNQATGGSRTADNLADSADVTKLDAGSIAALLRGNIGQASTGLVSRALTEFQGLTPKVAERVARALIETDPQRFLAIAEKAQRSAGGASLLARQAMRGAIAGPQSQQ